MPIDYASYPPNWREISDRIRFGRGAGRCECSGECGREHPLEFIEHDGRMVPVRRCPERHGKAATDFRGQVVLTVAHLCHDPQCADETHLRSMCQRCHLSYDAAHHARNAARTRRRKRASS